jgi:hypothetical protein
MSMFCAFLIFSILGSCNSRIGMANFTYKKNIYIIVVHFKFLVLNATFSNISAISWRPFFLVMEEAGVPGDNHRPWASNW